MLWRVYNHFIRHLSTTVYVNDKCLQLEKLFLQSNNAEQILSLLVTHRPHLFLHNAVKTIELLAEKSTLADYNPTNQYKKSHLSSSNGNLPSNHSSIPTNLNIVNDSTINTSSNCLPAELQDVKTASHPENMDLILTRLSVSPDSINTGLAINASERIIRDERYLLLLSDIYMHRNNLDLGSICKIVQSLRILNHTYYPLLNGLLHPLIKQLKNLVYSDNWYNLIGYTNAEFAINDLILCAKNFAHFGYHNTELYNIVSKLIMNNGLSIDNFMEKIYIYSQVDSCNDEILSKMSEFVLNNELTPAQLSWVACAFAKQAKGSGKYDPIINNIVKNVVENEEKFELDHLYRITCSASTMKLHYPELIKLTSQKLEENLILCTKAAMKPPLCIAEISKLLESLSYFGSCDKNVISSALVFFEDYIDNIAPSDALNIAKSVCLTQTHDLNSYMLNFIWRKIASDVSWETSAYEIFCLWLYHLIKFPWLTYNLPKRCIDEGFRQWVIHNSVSYDNLQQLIKNIFPRYPDLNNETQNELYNINEIEYPFVPDAIVNGKGLIFISEYARNDKKIPGGVDLIRKTLLNDLMEVKVASARDWEFFTVDQKRNKLLEMFS